MLRPPLIRNVLSSLVVAASCVSLVGALGCGGSSTPPTCQTTACASGSLTYQLCESGTTVTYEFGKSKCSFASTDQTQATQCTDQLDSYCGVGLDQ